PALLAHIFVRRHPSSGRNASCGGPVRRDCGKLYRLRAGLLTSIGRQCGEGARSGCGMTGGSERDQSLSESGEFSPDFAKDRLRLGFINHKPKSGSWRPAAVWQIADIMRYGQETRGFAAATGG